MKRSDIIIGNFFPLRDPAPVKETPIMARMKWTVWTKGRCEKIRPEIWEKHIMRFTRVLPPV